MHAGQRMTRSGTPERQNARTQDEWERLAGTHTACVLMCSCIFDPMIQRPRPWPEILCTYVYCTVLSVVTVLVHRIAVDAVMRGPRIVLDGRPNGQNQSPRPPTGGGGTRDAMQFFVPVAASVGRTGGRTDGREYQKPPRIRTESESCERQTRGAEAGKERNSTDAYAGQAGRGLSIFLRTEL